MVTTTQTMTADQLLAHSSELGPCELIRGKLRMLPFGDGCHGAVSAIIGFNLVEWSLKHGGHAYSAGTGFVLEHNPDTVRSPDVAWIAADRAAEADTPKFIPIAPDFVAEVLSPNDRAEDVAAKVQWWLSHGVKLVWVADPKNRCVTAHQPNGDGHTYRDGDTITGENVLPGLDVAIADLFG